MKKAGRGWRKLRCGTPIGSQGREVANASTKHVCRWDAPGGRSGNRASSEFSPNRLTDRSSDRSGPAASASRKKTGWKRLEPELSSQSGADQRSSGGKATEKAGPTRFGRYGGGAAERSE